MRETRAAARVSRARVAGQSVESGTGTGELFFLSLLANFFSKSVRIFGEVEDFLNHDSMSASALGEKRKAGRRIRSGRAEEESNP